MKPRFYCQKHISIVYHTLYVSEIRSHRGSFVLIGETNEHLGNPHLQ